MISFTEGKTGKILEIYHRNSSFATGLKAS